MVSNIFCFHPNFGKKPILTNIFGMGWNHQLVLVGSHFLMFVMFFVVLPVFLPFWKKQNKTKQKGLVLVGANKKMLLQCCFPEKEEAIHEQATVVGAFLCGFFHSMDVFFSSSQVLNPKCYPLVLIPRAFCGFKSVKSYYHPPKKTTRSEIPADSRTWIS